MEPGPDITWKLVGSTEPWSFSGLLTHHLHLNKITRKVTCTVRSEKHWISPWAERIPLFILQTVTDFSAKSWGRPKDLTGACRVLCKKQPGEQVIQQLSATPRRENPWLKHLRSLETEARGSEVGDKSMEIFGKTTCESTMKEHSVKTIEGLLHSFHEPARCCAVLSAQHPLLARSIPILSWSKFPWDAGRLTLFCVDHMNPKWPVSASGCIQHDLKFKAGAEPSEVRQDIYQLRDSHTSNPNPSEGRPLVTNPPRPSSKPEW